MPDRELHKGEMQSQPGSRGQSIAEGRFLPATARGFFHPEGDI